MKHYDRIELISDMPEVHGVHDEHQAVPRFVYCEIKSVGRREAYEAMGHGYRPVYVFVLSQAFDYQDEKLIRYNGVLYSIIRTYETEADAIELTAERVTN